MLQALLADGFKLTLRRYTKEQSVYTLTVGKDGPRLTAPPKASPKVNPLEKTDSQSPTAGPSVFEAVQQQYGLKLEACKAPIEMFAVTHAEKIPTEN